MKKVLKSFAVLFVLLSLTGTAFAEQPPVVKKFNSATMEQNLLMGVNSANTGLKVSSAYHLGEIKSDKAVLSLIKMLRDSEKEEERIAAALSLTKIGTTKAIYFVKEASKYDDSKRVRELCNKFYVNSVRG
ncbi:MAG: hypothetical protein SCALA702_11690 [Melioribacteraceae bacterium]|nr:MAG: hypothetical protein SCALA702_11690 [Melioribacteraceae bacterium]